MVHEILVPNVLLQGLWVFDQKRNNPYTKWADQQLHVHLGSHHDDRQFQMQLSVRNHGVVPPGYTHFDVDVFILGSRQDKVDLNAVGAPAMRLRIPASNDYVTVSEVVGVPPGFVQLTLVWRNDSYDPGKSDANIEYGNILFRQMG
jgi:hypothetical protein